jgi:pimeloyl-ACP methyl ester carboxylesterase
VVPGLAHRHFASFDDTEIAYQVRGDGPAVVLANGLGGTYEAFRHIYAALGERYRIVCWDYRGLYGSAAPRDRTTLTVEHQCRDLERLLDLEGIERAVVIGWSMGVQVAFEFFRERRPRVAGIVGINGTAGLAFRSALSSRIVSTVLPTLLRAVRTQATLVGATTRTLLGWSGAVPALQRLGLLSRTVDLDAFTEIAGGFATMNWDLYMDTLHRLEKHDAWDVLPTVDVPTLMITGDRDLLTPASTAERIHRAVAGSRLVVIPGGTHYTPVEYPAVITDALRGFMAGIPGWAPRAVDARDDRATKPAPAGGS